MNAADPTFARQAATGIVRTLRDAGYTAYFAGGCVRDALLGLHPTDYDVATDAVPEVVAGLFRSTDRVGAAFGVVLVHQRVRGERITVEVATFRSDGPYSDARRPDVVHFSDPRADAARRDFTINALFLDPLDEPDSSASEGGAVGAGETPSLAAETSGRLIDHVGGLDDLRARVVRAVGDPARRLAEDHLRALRAIRFAARLGFTIEPATAAAIRRDASELRGVSRERIGDELRRMLVHPARADAVALLQQLTLDGPVLNEPARHAPLATLAGLSAGARPVSPMLALAAWLLDRHSAAHSGLSDESMAELKRRVRASLCLSNDESDELGHLLLGHQHLIRAWAAANVARRKRWAVSPWFEGVIRLVETVQPELALQIQQDLNKMRTDGIGIAPDPLISGDDLSAAGMKPGPVFRRILDQVYDAQLEGRVTTVTQAMELAATLYV